MGKKSKFVLSLLVVAAVTFLGYLYTRSHSIAVLDPAGIIASEERDLIIVSTLLMLIIVIPVYVLTFAIAWKYRSGNTKAKYRPDWDHHSVLEFSWWAIPGVIILVLAAIAWKSSYQLHPQNPISSSKKPLTIQVIALQWKWLFIYPDQNIATVNIVQFPQQTPIDFKITADAPMNSFWIPQLGGQIYAMPGMSTRLHLMADSVGNYRGSSANLSGEGFAGMNFAANSLTQSGFDNWVKLVKQTPGELSFDQYNRLAKPSKNDPLAYYSSSDDGLYQKVVAKYLAPPQLEGPSYQPPRHSGEAH